MHKFIHFQSSGQALLLCITIVSSLFSISAHAVPNVVVTIPPIHSLVSAVMSGVAEPELLIPGGQSPHSNSLKPSAIRQLGQADLLVWISPEFELSLKKMVAQQDNLRVISLLDEPAMHILPPRKSDAWQSHHATGDRLTHSEHASSGVPYPDMHLWLSAENAIEVVRATTVVLSEMDLKNKHIYQRNSLQVIEKIEKIQNEILESLLPVKDVSYLVFHDAYQYFEHEFGLSPVGAVTVSPERKPGIKTLLAIKQTIQQQDAKCIFHEPQFQPRLVARIAEETGIQTGELDPVGAELQPGPELWFGLMLALRDNILRCTKK